MSTVNLLLLSFRKSRRYPNPKLRPYKNSSVMRYLTLMFLFSWNLLSTIRHLLFFLSCNSDLANEDPDWQKEQLPVQTKQPDYVVIVRIINHFPDRKINTKLCFQSPQTMSGYTHSWPYTLLLIM